MLCERLQTVGDNKYSGKHALQRLFANKIQLMSVRIICLVLKISKKYFP